MMLGKLGSCGTAGVFCALAFGAAACSDKVKEESVQGWFEESAQARGIDFEWVSGHRERFYFPEIMGGGAALFDMDTDGDLDLYLVQAGRIDVEAEADQPANQLFANNGPVNPGSFRNVSHGSGSGDRGYGMGVAAGDYDDDGLVDLYVTNVGPNVMLRNLGEQRFEDVTSQTEVGDPTWTASAGFVDYDADGDLDLYAVNYIYWSAAEEISCYSKPHPTDYCSPKSYNAPARDSLYCNLGDGTFEDVSARVGLQQSYGNGLGVVFSDFDGDGHIDIFVANDGMKNQLWRNVDGEHFEDVAERAGCAVDQDGRAKAGMGTAAADIDDDGDEDLLVVNLSGEPDSFYRNDGDFFADRTPLVGLAVASRAYTRFGLGLADFNNDGYLDIYQANGRVTRAPEASGPRPFDEENLLFQGLAGGRFREVSPRGGTARKLRATSRAAAFGDVDGDGGIDVVVVNRDSNAFLLINQVSVRGRWIGFRLLEKSGRPALGATLSCQVGQRAIMRRAHSAYSYCAANDPTILIGLAEATQVSGVEVLWADGTRESLGTFHAGSVVDIRHGDGE